MFKNIIRNYQVYLFISSIFFIGSCSKSFLDVQPPTSQNVSSALKSDADVLVAIRGMYAGMRSSNLYGRTIPLLGDLMADVTYISASNSNRYINQQAYVTTINDANVSGMWGGTGATGGTVSFISVGAYSIILRANNIINAEIASTVNVDQYKGEAYATRALMYFELIRFFAKPYTDNADAPGIPIVLTYNPAILPPRNTVKEVYTQIVKDLTEAVRLMTVTAVNSSQFSKYAAKGLLAKVYLTMGDYANAKTAAEDVINNSGFTVVTAAAHAAYWANPAPRTDKVETLFEVSSDATNNAGTDALAYIYSQSGYGDMMAAKDLYNSYASTDVRIAYLKKKFRGGDSAWTVEKYSNVSNISEKDEVKVLRLSDVYLVAAEAAYNTGNETDAKKYVNYIAVRRTTSFTGYTSTGAALLNDILTERKKELAFEGDRFHTLNRLKLPIQRNTDYPVAARTIPYGDFRRILPIPQDELNANPSIQQNDGYK